MGTCSSSCGSRPAYGGSLIERAPFALLPGLWGGGALEVYRAVAAPCLLATALLGVWLLARMRSAGGPRLARAVALAVCVANPITLRALELGHPEELLGACLCVAAVLLAGAARRAVTVRCSRERCWAWRSPTRSGRCWRPARCCSPCHRGRRMRCLASAGIALQSCSYR